jgi:hypothetical protein
MRHAVLVDPYAGARDYGAAFRARGVPTVAVLSTREPLATFRAAWSPEDFDQVLAFDGDLEGLVERLRPLRPLCALAGNESGVELAETLTERLAPEVGNTAGGTAARRDKWHMAQALRRAGVPVIRQLCSKDPDEVADWLGRAGLGGSRLVLKPPKSGGTDGVHVVDAGQDWRPVFEHLMTTVNRFEAANEAVLVQEFVAGTEYVVDTYSVAGRHGLAEVCRYAKGSLDRRGARRLGVYLRTDFVPPDHPQVPALFDYTRRVLDALGIRNGAAHAEVMLTANGPLLVEVAARLAGTPLQYCARLATGDCQIDRAVRHLLDGSFTAGYALRQHVAVACLAAPRAGVLRNAEVLDPVHELPTARRVHLPFRTGDEVPATADLFTQLGWVVLASPGLAALDEDYRRVRAMEHQLAIA